MRMHPARLLANAKSAGYEAGAATALGCARISASASQISRNATTACGWKRTRTSPTKAASFQYWMAGREVPSLAEGEPVTLYRHHGVISIFEDLNIGDEAIQFVQTCIRLRNGTRETIEQRAGIAIRRSIIQGGRCLGGVERQCPDRGERRHASREATRQNLTALSKYPFVGDLYGAGAGSDGGPRRPNRQASVAPV
jgi:hypothetical protein